LIDYTLITRNILSSNISNDSFVVFLISTKKTLN